MLANRSIPPSTVIPVLAYSDMPAAVTWLCDAFGFVERLRIGDHRTQLEVGTGALVVVQREGSAPSVQDGSVMIRVDDAHAHCARATRHGARIVLPPTDYPFGERQYSADDPEGHRWTFSQSVADVDPATWGGVMSRS